VARRNFNEVARKALKGDLDVNDFAAAARQFLEEQQQLSGSGAGFQAAFARVMDLADRLGIDLRADLQEKKHDFKLSEDMKHEARKDRRNRDKNTEQVLFSQEALKERLEQQLDINEHMLEELKEMRTTLAQGRSEDVA